MKRRILFKEQWRQALHRRSKLPLGTQAVLAALAAYASGDGTRAFPSQTRLAEELGCSSRTVGRALTVGRDSGWIQRVRQGNSARATSDEYHLTIPKIHELDEDQTAMSVDPPYEDPWAGLDDNPWAQAARGAGSAMSSPPGTWVNATRTGGR